MSLYRLRRRSLLPLLSLALLATRTVSAQRPPQNPVLDLGGTSWQLVKFQSSADTTLTPDDKAKYTIAFGTNGRVSVRIDCNRGSGSWKTPAPSQIEFGPLALTRAMCPPGSLHDRIVKHWAFIRSYILKDGHLFLSLMADGGTYEFEPIGHAGTGAGPVQGNATYRERIAMPPNAAFEAILEDVSKAGAAAEVIARIRNEQPGNPPIPFVISYDPARINPSHSYAVRARILVDGTLWFATDQSYPVLTAGNGSTVQLLLRRANASSSAASPSTGPSTAPLEDTYWKLTNLGNAPITTASGKQEPHLILHAATRRVTGSGGCNQLTGGYQLRGDRLSFGQIAGTMMACVEGMETEKAFLQALRRVDRWKITGQRLELLDGIGALLARFDATHMK